MTDTLVLGQHSGDNWHLYNADSCDVMAAIPDNSLHFSIFSPPFCSLYTFSDSIRDVSNNSDDEVFWDHFGFIIKELYRTIMPGRLVTIHVMQLPTSKTRDGYIGMRDFRGDTICAFKKQGFIFHTETMIRKDPVSAMTRTKSIGLLHKQLRKDSNLSRMAAADYMVTMRKPGNNPEPITGMLDNYYGDITDEEFTAYAQSSWEPGGRRTFEEHKSICIWQLLAESVWTDINQNDVLSFRCARAEADERHISPLQLTPIRRCIQLWTNPGDVVFSPFAGIGSELYVALEMGRRGLGAELKTSYYEQALANIASLKVTQGDLFASAAE